MTTQLLFTPQQAFDDGVFAPGAKVSFFQAGTTTPVTVYTDEEYTIAHPSPVVADAAGVFPMVYYPLTQEVKAVITASDDTTIATVDPVLRVSSTGTNAASISYDPQPGNAQTNVQAAITDNTDKRESRSAAVKAMLLATDNDEIRTEIGLGTAAVLASIDEDSMASNSASSLPTQQSVKAYVDAEVGGLDSGLPVKNFAACVVKDGATGTGTRQTGGTMSRTGTGSYTFTFTAARPNTNYAALGQVLVSVNRGITVLTQTTTEATFRTHVSGNGDAVDSPFSVVFHEF